MHTAATHTQIQTAKFTYTQEWLVANFKLKSFTKTRPAVKLNSRSHVSSNFVLPKIVGLQHFADESVCLSMCMHQFILHMNGLHANMFTEQKKKTCKESRKERLTSSSHYICPEIIAKSKKKCTKETAETCGSRKKNT